MKNSESFNRELDLLDGGKPGTGGLSLLQQALRRNASAHERSDQHQAWAWTRLREELRSPRTSAGPVWKRFFLPALAGMALLAFGTYFLSGSASDLLIDSIGSDLYAETFKSGEAEVVWVTGYTYIPSSHPIQ